MADRIPCVDGPAEGKKIRPTMGERWPWVLEFDANTMRYMLGYYELRNGGYFWNPDSVETGVFGDGRSPSGY